MEETWSEMENVFSSSSTKWHLIHLLTLKTKQTADGIALITEYQSAQHIREHATLNCFPSDLC